MDVIKLDPHYYLGKYFAWAEQRNFKGNVTPIAQFAKIVEEFGEYTNAFATNDRAEQVDALGDIFVTCAVYLMLKGYNEDYAIINILWNMESFNSYPVNVKMPAVYNSVVVSIGQLAQAELKGYDGHVGGIVTQICTQVRLLAYLNEIEPFEYLTKAWNEIKDRKGKFINGSYVKEEDLG